MIDQTGHTLKVVWEGGGARHVPCGTGAGLDTCPVGRVVLDGGRLELKVYCLQSASVSRRAALVSAALG